MDRTNPRTSLSLSVLKALHYYDIFDFPLTREEIFGNLPTNHVSQTDVDVELDVLARQEHIYRVGPYFSLRPDLELASRRDIGSELAIEYLEIARRKARLISRFPFVESIMVSGSLSKGYADKNSDIDFFVITRANRLWIARTLLILYKRIFLLNSHKYFCLNYFIDTDGLEIRERNVYSATELATLIPLYGLHLHERLLSRNSWISNFLPNFKFPVAGCSAPPQGWMRGILEEIINHLWPEKFDHWLMKITYRFWKSKYGRFHTPADFKQAFRTDRHTSKGHNNNFQVKVVGLYYGRTRNLEETNLVGL